jgi:hypothetical protein
MPKNSTLWAIYRVFNRLVKAMEIPSTSQKKRGGRRFSYLFWRDFMALTIFF